MAASSFVDGSIHTSETVSVTFSYMYADNNDANNESSTDAYFTIPPGTFDTRYRMWRMSVDQASFGSAETAGIPNHTFTVMFSPTRRGHTYAGSLSNGLRAPEQPIITVTHWGDANNDSNPTFQFTNAVVENLNSRTVRFQIVSTSANYARLAVGDVFAAGGANPFPAGENLFTYTCSFTPILEPLMG